MRSHHSWLKHFEDHQNILDLLAILYLILYAVQRINYPYGSNLNYDKHEAVKATLSEEELRLYSNMPILHLIAMFLMFA